ncbi:MYXO-CTERM sorting domain-containing protein [Nannocystis pusilla]|uniref:MYXO-CTERM domain-containing protein n=1 Tax=Nannocystis pusilla TaxID=889268 RepID=A0ABS7TKA9_9BACT|nr:MYXO-CTERM sorting domain-containing protein [Nannocystis pusilla]MBZ5708649.1 hypothetical protein [Nannocystis pusilla]
MTRKNFFSLLTTGLGALVLIGGALVPTQARACDPVFDECLADLELMTEGPLPLDGALVWRPVFTDPEAGSFSQFAVESGATVVVTPMGGGAEVQGAVTGIQSVQAIVWRPTGELPADTTLEVEVTFDNSKLFCFGDFEPTLTRKFTVSTGSETAPPVVAPELTGETSVALIGHSRAETLICCDGAFPTWTMVDDCGLAFDWSEGTCASLVGTGWLDVALTLDADAVAAANHQVGYVFESNAGTYAFVAGSTTIAVRLDQPLCGKVRATRLATGEETLGPEVCFGEDLQAMLGEQVMDPLPTLAACAGQPYTCESISDGDETWDPNACTPWPEDSTPTTSAGSSGESDSSGSDGTSSSDGGASDSGTAGMDTDKAGCACASGPAGDGWGLAALLLPWLGRRRSRR